MSDVLTKQYNWRLIKYMPLMAEKNNNVTWLLRVAKAECKECMSDETPAMSVKQLEHLM